MQSLDYCNDKDRRKITSYVGVTYQFFSIKNEREFDNSPEKYASKYGGYCSIAISEGSLVEANPNSALIQIDELHVFYKDEDTQD
jgi:YHS domain-containing protein